MDGQKESDEVREERFRQIENNSQINRGGGSGDGGGGRSEGKSCKGYLYYSSTLKSNGNNPRCIGIPRTLPRVPNYVVSQSEAEASKEGRTLVDFYYACAGYSIYANKDRGADNRASKTELPVCMGLELLVDRKAPSVDNASAPAHADAREGAPAHPHAHAREDGREFPYPRHHKPSEPAGDDFVIRFTRNANLVASGVAKNLRRVGRRVKRTVDDFLYPFRRPPK